MKFQCHFGRHFPEVFGRTSTAIAVRTTVVSKSSTIAIQSTIGAILLGSGDTKRVLCGFGRWSYDLAKFGLVLEGNFVENSVMVGDITSGADKKLLVKSNEKNVKIFCRDSWRNPRRFLIEIIPEIVLKSFRIILQNLLGILFAITGSLNILLWDLFRIPSDVSHGILSEVPSGTSYEYLSEIPPSQEFIPSSFRE